MTIRQRMVILIDGHAKAIQVTDDGSRTLVDPLSGVAYHSASGALAETHHVYLKNSGIWQRLTDNRTASVLEIGLGTGLAMLTTVDAAIAAGARLQYTAVECELVDTELLRRLELQTHIRDAGLVDRFLDWRERQGSPATFGTFVWQASADQRVTIEYQDANVWASLCNIVNEYDAVYFDPFAPTVNPELWAPSFLRHIHEMLKLGGTLVTYCVNRQVRDAMQTVGFHVQRVPGPAGGKREVMVATKQSRSR